MEDKLFDVHEAAAVLHVSVSLLHHSTAAKEIGFFRLGKKVFFTAADLEGFMQSRRVEPAMANSAAR